MGLHFPVLTASKDEGVPLEMEASAGFQKTFRHIWAPPESEIEMITAPKLAVRGEVWRPIR